MLDATKDTTVNEQEEGQSWLKWRGGRAQSTGKTFGAFTLSAMGIHERILSRGGVCCLLHIRGSL